MGRGYDEGERVLVRGMAGNIRFHGSASQTEDGAPTVWVTPDGRRKPKPFASSRVFRASRTAPALSPLESPPNREPAELRAQPRPEPAARDRQYLIFVRSKPCCACGARHGIEPHHWARRGRNGGMGQKCDDHRTVPLCRTCHDHFHSAGFVPVMDERTNPRAATVLLFLAVQVDLLVEWIRRGQSS